MSETISLSRIYEELIKIESKMAKKDDLDALAESLEIIANPETMEMLKLSAKDKARGRIFEANSVKDLLKQNV